MNDFNLAMARAVRAIQAPSPLVSDSEAIEIIESISMVILETIKMYMPLDGENKCN
jgi:hypothetical protein